MAQAATDGTIEVRTADLGRGIAPGQAPGPLAYADLIPATSAARRPSAGSGAYG
jgi:hypothetical protein